jgi:uridine kinase
MIIKEAVYKKCHTCSSTKLTKDEELGCDFCETPLDYFSSDEYYLSISIYYTNREKETQYLHFCSWECCIKYLKKLFKHQPIDIDFISLPYLYFNDYPKKQQYKEFLKHLK